ncbi:class I SAM-dependent methyltransferase [Alphaproteobacteria bacterium]|nr:class I SAM-dependent methyltransferase [Alphaproteobacteria bacterium]
MSTESKYNRMISQGKTNFERVGWGSATSQQRRFQVLSQIGDISAASVLDVGCGLGDFYEFLVKNGFNCQYTGIDSNSNMIALAKDRQKGINVFQMDFNNMKFSEGSFDYVVLSGAFNLSEDNQGAKVLNCIRQLFSISRMGVAFNILSSHANKLESGEYYVRPEVLLSSLFSITKSIVLRHDYMEHDFTVYLYK